MRFMAQVMVCGCLSTLGFKVQQDDRDSTKQQIEQLKGLGSTLDREGFFGRPAMVELFVTGTISYPAIKDAFLASDDWSIQLSTGFLLSALNNGPDKEVRAKLVTLMRGPNTTVRAVSAALLSYGSRGKEAADVLAGEEERAIVERTGIGPFQVGWLKDTDLSRWVSTNLGAIDRGSPLVEPPTWRSGQGGTTQQGEDSSVTRAGLRVLKQDQRLAKIGIFNALTDSGRGHQVMEAVLRNLELDEGGDQGRLGLKLLLMDGIMNHTDAKCRGGICTDIQPILDRILSVCERWAFVSTDPWVLNATITTLSGLAGLNSKRAKELLEQIKERHPNLGAREFAGFHLNTLAERWEAEEKARERTKAHEERLQRDREARGGTPVPTAKVYRPSPSPKQDEPPTSSKVGYWIAIGSLGLVLVISVWTYRKKARARLAS